jgi:hypothetical protein
MTERIIQEWLFAGIHTTDHPLVFFVWLNREKVTFRANRDIRQILDIKLILEDHLIKHGTKLDLAEALFNETCEVL